MGNLSKQEEKEKKGYMIRKKQTRFWLTFNIVWLDNYNFFYEKKILSPKKERKKTQYQVRTFISCEANINTKRKSIRP